MLVAYQRTGVSFMLEFSAIAAVTHVAVSAAPMHRLHKAT